MKSQQRNWWKEGVVYQIYPRSFQDSNNDGMGDLNGITQRLDYIKSLGVNIIWLNPIYASPNDDNGYDISDYQSVHPDFGSMEDFDKLLKKAHDLGLKIIMDLVINHCSDEHFWFQEARKSRENPYRDYFHWWPAENGEPPARYSYFDVNNNAWQYEAATNSYYLHYFSVKQPDLNWENPRLRSEIYQMMHWWFNKGIDGFRMDVISFISKDPSFPELPEKYKGNFIHYYAEGPTLHQHLQEMHREVLSHYNCMTVGEAPGVKLDKALLFVDEDRHELNMFFHFDLMELDRVPGAFFGMRPGGYSLAEFKKIHSDWDAVFAQKGWGSIFLGNHDFPRAVSRWGNDEPKYHFYAATLLHTFLFTMRGTPYVYFGDEIGMTNVRFDKIEDYRDIGTLNAYKKAMKEGDNLDEFFNNHKESSRDNARVPMQWNKEKNAGFTDAEPWIKVNPNYATINVEEQELKPDSILNFFRKALQLRKNHSTLVYGSYELFDPEHPSIYSYLRSDEENKIGVVLNFSTQETRWKFPEFANKQKYKPLLHNYPDLTYLTSPTEISLRPFEAIVFQLI